jgi:hypothetical protein
VTRCLLLIVALGACSPSSPPALQMGDDAPVAGDALVTDGVDAIANMDACAMLANARCSELMTCSAADLTKQFGAMAECVARESLACDDGLAAPDTGSNPASAIACGVALTAGTCTDFLSNNAPAACIVAGPDTGTCAFAGQCSTAFCSIGANSLCGLCQDEPVAGASCTANGCGHILVCDGNNNLCAMPAEANQACNKTIPCDHGLACVGDTNQNNGSCEPTVATLGGACDQTRKVLPTCSGDAGLTCNANTNRCVAQPLAAAGAACGPINGVETDCTAGAQCVIPMSQSTGTCIAPAADGGACNTAASGPGCLYPARCIPTAPPATAGTCQLPGSQSC